MPETFRGNKVTFARSCHPERSRKGPAVCLLCRRSRVHDISPSKCGQMRCVESQIAHNGKRERPKEANPQHAPPARLPRTASPKYTFPMEPNRFGRKLGIGVRVASRMAKERAAKASATASATQAAASASQAAASGTQAAASASQTTSPRPPGSRPTPPPPARPKKNYAEPARIYRSSKAFTAHQWLLLLFRFRLLFRSSSDWRRRRFR